MKITNKSLEVAALALANNIGDEGGPFADLTEVQERWGAKGLTQLASDAQATILAALPYLESDRKERLDKLCEWLALQAFGDELNRQKCVRKCTNGSRYLGARIAYTVTLKKVRALFAERQG